ncbi:hypothetical protein IJT10_08475 [bacterium]|nr:hypothetical protein [bacterium]
MVTIGTQSLSQLVKVNITQQKVALELHKAVYDKSSDAYLCEKFSPLSTQLDALRVVLDDMHLAGSLLWVGTYGVGKTTLMLLLGRLFSVEVPSDEFNGLLKSINDVSIVKSITQLRSSEHKYLVVAPEFAEDVSFKDAMRDSLKQVVSARGVGVNIDSNASLEDNCREIIEALRVAGDFGGLMILGDGIDEVVKESLKNSDSAQTQDLKNFCEFCRSSKLPIVFVSCIDRDLSLFSLEDETKLVNIFQNLQSVSLVGRGGEWEELVSSKFISHVEGELWEALKEYKDVRSVSEELTKFNLYKGSSDRWINNTVMLGAYPIHPAVLFALPRVSALMSGNNRTVINFFTDSVPGGLPYFLRNFAIAQNNGRLHLYTIDSLFTYFEKVFTSEPQNADHVKTLNKSIVIAGDIPQARRILRIVLLIQLIGHESFLSTKDIILWAMHLGPRELRVATQSLEQLKAKGALSYNESTGEYLLPIERKKLSLDEIVSRTSNRVRSQLDVASSISSRLPFTRINADNFNKEYFTDRYASTNVVMASSVTDWSAFRNKVLEDFQKVRPYHGDLKLIFVVSENDDELENFNKAIEEGILDSPRLVFVFPKKSAPISKKALSVLALEKICASELPFCDPNSTEHSKAEERLQGEKEALDEALSAILDLSKNNIRYNGRSLQVSSAQDVEDLINEGIAELIGEPLSLSDRDLLKVKEKNSARKFRSNLVTYMLNCFGDLAIRIKDEKVIELLYSALIEPGFLEEKEAEEGWRRFSILKEIPSTKAGIAYEYICSQLVGKAGTVSVVEASKLVNSLSRSPYGLTPAMIEVLLSLAFWQYSGCLSIGRQSLQSIIEGKADISKKIAPTAQVIYNLVSDPEDWQFIFCDCSESEYKFLKDTGKLLGTEFSEDELFVWSVCGNSLRDFYENLPPAARVVRASGNELSESLRAKLEEIRFAEYIDFKDFYKRVLPSVLKIDIGKSFEDNLEPLMEAMQTAIEGLSGLVEGRFKCLCAAFKDIFASDSDGKDWYTCAVEWSQNVSDDSGKWRGEFAALNSLKDCHSEREAVDTLLENLGYEDLEHWPIDYSAEIIERFKVMRRDVQWGRYRGSCVLESKEMVALGILQAVLEEFSSYDLENFLSSELEWASWPEFVADSKKDTDEVIDEGDLAQWTYDGFVSEVVSQYLNKSVEEVSTDSVSVKSRAYYSNMDEDDFNYVAEVYIPDIVEKAPEVTEKSKSVEEAEVKEKSESVKEAEVKEKAEAVKEVEVEEKAEAVKEVKIEEKAEADKEVEAEGKAEAVKEVEVEEKAEATKEVKIEEKAEADKEVEVEGKAETVEEADENKTKSLEELSAESELIKSGELEFDLDESALQWL